jgi:hypothetical protein
MKKRAKRKEERELPEVFTGVGEVLTRLALRSARQVGRQLAKALLPLSWRTPALITLAGHVSWHVRTVLLLVAHS